MTSSPHDTEAEVTFNLEVRVPRDEVPTLLEKLTGNDDDVILAAETALREAIDAEIEGFSGLEISPEPDLDLKLAAEAAAERRSIAIYGPTTKVGS